MYKYFRVISGFVKIKNNAISDNIHMKNARLNSTSIGRIRKRVYPRMYPVRVINPDGSSYMIRYEEPIGVIQLPQDPNTLSDEEKKARLRRLKGEQIIDYDKDFENDDVHFDKDAVRDLLRKTKK